MGGSPEDWERGVVYQPELLELDKQTISAQMQRLKQSKEGLQKKVLANTKST